MMTSDLAKEKPFATMEALSKAMDGIYKAAVAKTNAYRAYRGK